MQKSRRTALFFILLSLPVSLHAASSAQMNVSVQVVARTLVTVDQQPASVEISPVDVARGYVDVPAAVAFSIRSNSRNGYALQFGLAAGPFSSAQLSWGSATVNVGTDGSWLTQPYQPALTNQGTMAVRLLLSPGVNPGTYAWPLSFSAESL
jgi:hypothetical protein